MKKYTFDKIKEIVESNGFELLNADDPKLNAKITIKCSEGHIKTVTFNSFLKRPICYKCNPHWNAMSEKVFLEKLANSNTNCKLISKYTKASDKMKFKCLGCDNEFYARGQHILDGHKCRTCALSEYGDKKRKSHEVFENEIKEKYGDEFILLSEYKGDKEKIKCLHTKCGKISEKNAGTLLENGGCKYCKESKGEKAIKLFLENNHIQYEREYRNKECKYKYTLPFDFAIYKDDKLKFLIEYDGELHYKPGRWKEAKNKFTSNLMKDNIKSEFAKQHKIKLIRIPYWEFNNIDEILYHELRTLL